MSAIGTRLREERSRLGLGQEQMGEVGGVNRNTQANYEKGERKPDADYLAAVAAIGVDVLYVITGVRSAPSREELAPQEGALIEKYRLLSDSDKAHAQAVVGAFADKSGCTREVK